MRFLLDTHALAWAVGEPSRLSVRVRKLLADPSNQAFVSSASVWEMSIKCRAGRWPEVMPFMDERLYAGILDELGAVELAISGRHARVAGQFELDHQDPFDRIIAAQSFLEGLPLVSKDSTLDAFPLSRIW
jgi:PIN domain nuclease of toxin-antitoxin system